MPAVPGVQRRQVRQEDLDWRGLRVAGQGRPAQAGGQLAQAARQHRPDPLVKNKRDESVCDARDLRGAPNALRERKMGLCSFLCFYI